MSQETIKQKPSEPLFKLDGRSTEYKVHDIVNNHLSHPGKYIRPKIIDLFGNLFGVEEEDRHLLSRSAELIHTATLIHDDVVDGASFRRGEATLNKTITSARAVLAGDFLLARVIADLVGAEQYEPLKRISEALEDIVEGEFMQDQLKISGEVNRQELIKISTKKTGALLGWCSSACAIVGKQSEEVIEKSRLFGEKVGVCFQMIDDNLDYTPTSGKDQDKDLKDGLINFTTLNLYENFPELYYTIYQIRGTNFQERPWTAEQANVAKKETIKEVDLILLDVKKLFIEIVAESKSTSSESCIHNMFKFLDQIRDRSR